MLAWGKESGATCTLIRLISDAIMSDCTVCQLDRVPPGGAPVFTHSADVSTAMGAQEAVEACVGNFGPLDVLICCQGSSNPLTFSEASVESLEEVRRDSENCLSGKEKDFKFKKIVLKIVNRKIVKYSSFLLLC